MEVDYIIVGGGIAGCSLAMELVEKDCSVAMVDDLQQNASSRVAAGLLNPIVPKRVTTTWNAGQIFKLLPSYYQKLEKKLGQSFYFSMPMVQIHASEAEAKLWRRQSNKEEISNFITPVGDTMAHGIPAPFGYTEIHHCGRLQVQVFCRAVADFIRQNGILLQEVFSHDKLQIHSAENYPVHYGNILAKGIIFCEGTRVKNNPFFADIPILPSWGDILEIHTETSPEPSVIFKQKHWVVPIAEKNYLAGSNFLNDETNMLSQQTEAQQMVEQIRTWFPVSKLIGYQRGARPVVVDRRPVLGKHSQEPAVYIFNGLGTKGCSLVSWLAPIMAAYILHRSPIPEEVKVSRFFSGSGHLHKS